MLKGSVKYIVNKFVSELTEAIRGDAQQEIAQQIKKRLDQFGVGFGEKPIKVRKKTRKVRKKTNTAQRPCPVPECKEEARSRYQLVCKKHNEELDRGDILLHRDVAEKPGGVWYELGMGPHANAERRKANAELRKVNAEQS